MAVLYYDSNAATNGDGSEGSPYNTPTGTAFGANTWNLKAGSVWDSGSSTSTCTNGTIIQKWGEGDDPIIQSTNSTCMNISTANNVVFTNIAFRRTSGASSGTGISAQQVGASPSTPGLTMTGGSFDGFNTCLNLDRADNVTITGVYFGTSSTTLGITAGAYSSGNVTNLHIHDCTFTGGAGISLQVSSVTDTDGVFTGLEIVNNTFDGLAGSPITMRSTANSISTTASTSVTAPSTITRSSAWPVAWTPGKRIFLGGFVNPENFGYFTVSSVSGAILTVTETSLTTESSATGKGIYLIDPDQAYISPKLAHNYITNCGQTPFLIDNFYGGVVEYNTIVDSTGTDIVAAGIELLACIGTRVRNNTIINVATNGSVDAMGIFADGGCQNLKIYRNYVSDLLGTDRDNSGAGLASFYSIDCEFFSNIVERCKRGYWAGGTAGSGNKVYRNTFANCDIGARTNSSPPTGYTEIKDNMFINNLVGISDASSETVAGNAWWNNEVDNANGDLSAIDTSAITTDPELDANFTPKDTSPLKAASSINPYQRDYHGKARSNPASIGAVEARQSRSSTTTERVSR